MWHLNLLVFIFLSVISRYIADLEILWRILCRLRYHQEIERILDRATPKTNRVGGRRSSNEIRPVNSPRIRTEKRAPQDNNLFQFRNDDGPAEAFSMRSIFVSVILGRRDLQTDTV